MRTRPSYRISPTAAIKAAGYTIANSEVIARSCTFGKFDPNLPSQDQLIIGSGTVAYGTAAATDGIISFYRKTGAGTFSFENVLPAGLPTLTGTRWGNAVAGIQLDSGTLELVVGAPTDSTQGASAGAAYIFNVTTASGDFVLTQTGEAFYGGTDFDNNEAGSAIAVGNVWGHLDGTQDLVVAANLDDNTITLGANSINLGQIFTYRNVNGAIEPSAEQSQFDYRHLNAKVDHRFGQGLCNGDVNNDGIEDVIIGAPGIDYVPEALSNNLNSGQVGIYYGVQGGEIDFINPSQVIYAPGAQADSYFGWSCLVMDYNADGQNDLLVGSAHRNIGGNGDRGIVYIYQGDANSPLPTSATSTLNSPTATTNGYFGFSLAKGDLDGNGHDDLIVGSVGINTGANGSGRVHVYWASDTAPHPIESSNRLDLSPPTGAVGGGTNPHLAQTQNLNVDMHFGRAVHVFPTVANSLGNDLIVCSSRYDALAGDVQSGSVAAADLGYCWIYEGRVNAGLGSSYTMDTFPKNDIRYPSGYSAAAANIRFGEGITSGDWNADGTKDLIICSARQTNLQTALTNAGACFAYFGKATGGFLTGNGYRSNFGGTRFSPLPDDVHYNPNPEPTTATEFGTSVLLMDINNNTNLDLLIGEPFSDNPTSTTNLGNDSGRVYIIRGGY